MRALRSLSRSRYPMRDTRSSTNPISRRSPKRSSRASSKPNRGSKRSSHASPFSADLSTLSREVSITRSMNSSRLSSSRNAVDISKSLNASSGLSLHISAQPMKNQANHEDTPFVAASSASAATASESFSS